MKTIDLTDYEAATALKALAESAGGNKYENDALDRVEAKIRRAPRRREHVKSVALTPGQAERVKNLVRIFEDRAASELLERIEEKFPDED